PGSLDTHLLLRAPRNLNVTRSVALGRDGGLVALHQMCAKLCWFDARSLDAQHDRAAAADDRAEAQRQNSYCAHGSSCSTMLLNSDSSSLNAEPLPTSTNSDTTSARPSVATYPI